MSVPEVVTVVLGAGASYDIWDGKSPASKEYQPPLTRELFDFVKRPWLVSLAHDLPGMLRLHGELVRAAETDQRGLEKQLQELANHPVKERQRWYRDVPPFLQAQLHAVSRSYLGFRAHSLPGTPGGGHYLKLVDDLFHTGKERLVVFITLNYDDFLEQALAVHHESQEDLIRSMDDYAHQGRAWRLAKVHGSIDWFMDLSSAWHPTDRDRPQNWRAALVAFEIGDFNRTIRLNREVSRVWSGPPPYYYPVLTAPVAEKGSGSIVCPPTLLKSAHEWMRRSSKTLVIGTSGYDGDLGAFLKQSLPQQNIVHIVTKGSEDDAKALRERLWPSIPMLGDGSGMQVYHQGFGHYLWNGGFQTFLGLANVRGIW